MKIKTDRETLLQVLSEGPLSVTFVKKDGTERVMRCTRSFPLIPESSRPSNIEKNENTAVIKAYDLEVEGWRSFIVENVISAEQ